MLNFVVPNLLLEELEKDPQFKQKVLDELKAANIPFDLARFAREYVSDIGKLHETLRILWSKEVDEAFKTHELAESDFYGEFPSAVHVGLVGCKQTNSVEYDSLIHIALNSIKLHRFLVGKHRIFETFGRRFVSSVPIANLST